MQRISSGDSAVAGEPWDLSLCHPKPGLPLGALPWANVSVCSQVKTSFTLQGCVNSQLFNTGVIHLYRSIIVMEAKGQVFHCPGPERSVGKWYSCDLALSVPFFLYMCYKLCSFNTCLCTRRGLLRLTRREASDFESELTLKTSGLHSCCCHWFLVWLRAGNSAHWSEQAYGGAASQLQKQEQNGNIRVMGQTSPCFLNLSSALT